MPPMRKKNSRDKKGQMDKNPHSTKKYRRTTQQNCKYRGTTHEPNRCLAFEKPFQDVGIQTPLKRFVDTLTGCCQETQRKVQSSS